MTSPLLTTKLYIPPAQTELVSRPRLIEQLNAGFRSGHKFTLISTPAGFGKTTLVNEWIQTLGEAAPSIAVAWLSLDASDNDPTRFLAYFIAALQQVDDTIGQAAQGALASPQPYSPETLMTSLINEISAAPNEIVLVLDDYHVIESPPIDQALTFLLEHLPPQMHLVIATREDPNLPLARYRVGGQLTELRVADLRFTPAQAAEFLNRVMGLNLSAKEIAALETRTEGWIAGLQLAAISMQGHQDTAGFIQSFTGSHRFVMDYLLEEVLHQQPENIQTFLLRTSILDRLCGSLCDAVLQEPSISGQETLEYLERANLFIVPLDDERRWYRYHHLFADLLRQRLLPHSHQSTASPTGNESIDVTELHIRASQWYEENNLEIEAFHHAAAANDIERAERLIEGGGMGSMHRMPLQFRGAVVPVLNWLASLPTTTLDARPGLWVMYASALSMTGQLTGVEHKLQAAEAALQDAEPNDETRNLIGHIAAIRALLAATQYQVETIIAQSRRALEYLHPDNLAVRTATIWKMGIAYQLQGERTAARQAYTEAIAISEASGNTIISLAATTGLGNVQELDNQLHRAAQTYRRVLQLAGDPPLPGACEAYLGLARIHYQWNDLDAAQRHGQQSVQLARLMENMGQSVACEVFLARLKLAQGDVNGASAILDRADQLVRQHNFEYGIPEVAAAQVLTLLQQGNLAAAAQLAETHELPLSQARVHLARGDPAAALAVLGPWRQQVEAKDWQDDVLKVTLLQAVAHHAATRRAAGEKDKAVQRLGEALALAQPGGFIRSFVDEGAPMADLLSEAAAQGIAPDYVSKLLAAFKAPAGLAARPGKGKDRSDRPPSAQPLVEPLSPRELEVLQLIAQGLSNREIGERLFIALSTVKGHNWKIYNKLQVKRRTEAVARARKLGLL